MISIIIPTLNEEKNIGSLLSYLEKYKLEIIVVDGGSSDNTINIVKTYDVKLITTNKGRAKQMNFGAKFAKGDILFFLHADTVSLPENFSRDITNSMEKYDCGSFYRYLDSNKKKFKYLSLFANKMSEKMKIFFGDQGLFIKKDIFDEIGGFPDLKILEDCEIWKKLRRKKIKVIKDPLVTSSRRFEKIGFLKTYLIIQAIKILYLVGYNINSLKRFYPEVR